MATITGLTAARMLAIEAASVVDGEVVGDDLILTKHDASTINAGNVRGSRANRNRIINGDFAVNQRGFTSTTTSGFGHDRWAAGGSGGTTTYSNQTPALGDLPESAKAFARLVSSGQSAAADFAQIIQSIESVRSLSGKTVTVSFWAKAGSGTPKVAIEFSQYFGSGGSPSSTVYSYAGQVTLSTSWVRYSISIAIPSIAGKTLGTDEKDALYLELFTSAGSNYNARTGSLGLQNTTIDFWGVQVEEGSTLSPFEQEDYATNLRRCQRYFQRYLNPPLRGYTNGSSQPTRMGMPIPRMRVAPSPTFSGVMPVVDSSAVANATLFASYCYAHTVEFDFSSTGLNPNRPCAVYQGGNANYLELSAEL